MSPPREGAAEAGGERGGSAVPQEPVASVPAGAGHRHTLRVEKGRATQEAAPSPPPCATGSLGLMGHSGDQDRESA